MNIGITGLGLIGGSLAKAFTMSGVNVYAYDLDKSVQDYAQMTNVIKGELNKSAISKCDYIFIALYPKATIDYLNSIAEYISKDTIVIDCCGVKVTVDEPCKKIAKEYGFTYIGGHPMAGTQFSGFKNTKDDLFQGATMILVPKHNEDLKLLQKVKDTLKLAGFKHISITNAAEHDRLIAFTSQLAHIVSNAYIKSPTANNHHNYSAGSYKDLTRVAKLNEKMWTELFIDNRDNLTKELDYIISSLEEYRDAIKNEDSEKLEKILRDGRLKKEEVDTQWKDAN